MCGPRRVGAFCDWGGGGGGGGGGREERRQNIPLIVGSGYAKEGILKQKGVCRPSLFLVIVDTLKK